MPLTTEAMDRAKRTPVPEDQDDDGVELEWELIGRALEAKAKAQPKEATRRTTLFGQPVYAVPKTPEEADAPIRLSYQEILELLPFLEKGDKKKLHQQLKVESAPSNRHQYPVAPGQSNKTFAQENVHGYSAAPGSASSSRDDPRVNATSRAAAALGASLQPPEPKPKVALKAELEQFRRELYIQQLDRHGCLRPSSCAPLPRGQQTTCPHLFDKLKWGANASAQYARCGGCNLQHVIYYDMGAKQVLMVGSGPAVQPVTEPDTEAAVTGEDAIALALGGPAAVEVKSEGIAEEAIPKPPPGPPPPELLQASAGSEEAAGGEEVQQASPLTPPPQPPERPLYDRPWFDHASRSCRIVNPEDPDDLDKRFARRYYWDQIRLGKLPYEEEPTKIAITPLGGNMPDNWDRRDWRAAKEAVKKAAVEETSGAFNIKSKMTNFKTVLRHGNTYLGVECQSTPPPTNFNHSQVGGLGRDMHQCEMCHVTSRDESKFDLYWRVCLNRLPTAQQQLVCAQSVDDIMHPYMPESPEPEKREDGRWVVAPGFKSRKQLNCPGFEPDWINLVRGIFRRNDLVRLPHAADLVLQARPRERLLYRRLCKLYQEIPDEDSLEYLPKPGYCMRCEKQNPYFA